jgi:leucyl-tRNA---protein transferase
MIDTDVTFINEEFHAHRVSPAQMDELLAIGWRHFGTQFFRYNFGFYDLDIRRVIPLRIRLSKFSPSKSQRRVLRRNADLETVVRPVEITEEAEKLFHRHKRRFTHGVPDSIYDFLSREPAACPIEAEEFAVFDDGRLIAVSYFDIGGISISGTYAMFDPSETGRGLGIFTMLKEIEFSIDAGKDFYYQGYAYEGNSFYDYKKRFRGSEAFDWNRGWETLGNLQ